MRELHQALVHAMNVVRAGGQGAADHAPVAAAPVAQRGAKSARGDAMAAAGAAAPAAAPAVAAQLPPFSRPTAEMPAWAAEAMAGLDPFWTPVQTLLWWVVVGAGLWRPRGGVLTCLSWSFPVPHPPPLRWFMRKARSTAKSLATGLGRPAGCQSVT